MVNEYQWLWMGYYCDIKNRYSWINISGKRQNFCRFSGAAICESLLLELDGRPLVLGRLEGVHLGMLGSHGVLMPCEMCEIGWNFCHVFFLTCLYFLLVGADWNRNGFFSPIVGMMMFNLTKSIIFQVKTTSFFGGGVPNITRFGTFQAGTRWIAVGLWTSQLRR